MRVVGFAGTIAPIVRRRANWGKACVAAASLFALPASQGCVARGTWRQGGGAAAVSAAPPDPDLALIDAAADPCVDFATYACGPVHGRLVRAGDQMASRGRSLMSFLDDLASGRRRSETKAAEIVGEFYRRCTSVDARNEGLRELRGKLDAISRIQTMSELARALGALRASGVAMLVGLEFGWDPRALSNPIVAVFHLEGPHLPKPMYAKKARLVAEHREHWQRLAKLSGVLSPEEVEAAVRIDAWLALPGKRDGATRAVEPAIFHRGDLPASSFPWGAYLDGLGAPPDMPLGPKGLLDVGLIDRLDEHPLEDLKSYVRTVLVERYAEYLSLESLDEEQRFHVEVTAGGKRARLPPGPACAILTARDLGALLAGAYLPSFAAPASEALARRMFDDLRAQFAQTVSRASWMDPDSRRAAVGKIDGIGLRLIGDVAAQAPDVSLSGPGSFLDAHLALDAAASAADLASAGKPPPVRPVAASLNPASYFDRQNVVWLSPEIVRAPYLGSGALSAFSFGAIGTTVGHEIAHALGPTARRFDAAGVFRETWSRPAVRTFETRIACLSGEAGADVPGLEVTSRIPRSTVDESVADLVGVQVALHALEAEAPRFISAGELPRGRREFFIAYAQTLCAFAPDPVSEVDTLRDPHSPRRARINGVVANIPAFAETFACRAGTPMAPPERCEVW